MNSSPRHGTPDRDAILAIRKLARDTGADVQELQTLYVLESLLARIVALDLPPVTMLGYPLTMVLAEKITTAIDHGEANTRWRDFADVYVLTRSLPVDANELRRSMYTVATFRGVTLRPLSPTLDDMPHRVQPRWHAWRIRTNRTDDLPEEFAEVLAAVANFIDPVLTETTLGSWDPYAKSWG